MQKFKNPLFVIFFTVFLDLLGVGILIPVIPQLLAVPGSEYNILPSGWTLNDGFILLGFLTASYPLAQFFASPILGQMSDKYGRKKVLAISLVGTVLGYILFAIGIMTKNLPLLFAARMLDGVTGGNIAVAQAAIADITTKENRARSFGLIGMAFGLGFILGPYIGGKLSDPSILSWFDATTPFWFAALLSAVNVGLVLTIFPETHKSINALKSIKLTQAFANIKRAFEIKEMGFLFLTVFLFTGGFTLFTSFSNVFLSNKFGFTQGNIGDFFAYVGVWIAVTQGLITRRVANKFKEYQVLRLSLVMTGIGLLLFIAPNNGFQLLFIVPIFAVFNGLTQANIQGLISKSASAEVQGEVLGINSSVQALAQGLLAAASGYVQIWFFEIIKKGDTNLLNLASSGPLLIGSIIMILTGILFIIFYKTSIADSNTSNQDQVIAAH